jgi:hypothetical protein
MVAKSAIHPGSRTTGQLEIIRAASIPDKSSVIMLLREPNIDIRWARSDLGHNLFMALSNTDHMRVYENTVIEISTLVLEEGRRRGIDVREWVREMTPNGETAQTFALGGYNRLSQTFWNAGQTIEQVSLFDGIIAGDFTRVTKLLGGGVEVSTARSVVGDTVFTLLGSVCNPKFGDKDRAEMATFLLSKLRGEGEQAEHRCLIAKTTKTAGAVETALINRFDVLGRTLEEAGAPIDWASYNRKSEFC